jgi:hypothetical protein
MPTPGGVIEVARQQWRAEDPTRPGRWEWVARRDGEVDWCRGASAREAIGRAMGLDAGAWPDWLTETAREAERELPPTRLA